jgi:hypothetical protein
MTIWVDSGRIYRTQISGERQITREKNDEIRMTKPEGMTNHRIPSGYDAAFSSFVFRASFVIRHSCFVISCCPS